MSDDTQPPENPILEKIRKLLRRTSERGASKAEAETAMQMAQKLMVEHQISSIDVGDPDQKEAKRLSFEIVEDKFQLPRKRNMLDESLIPNVLRRCFQVRTLYSDRFELVESKRPILDRWTGEKHYGKVMVSRHVYWMYGDRQDVEIAKIVIGELDRAARHALNRHLRQNGISWNAVTARSFYEGLESGYIAANKRGREEALIEAGETARDQYAIVLQGKEEAVADRISQVNTVRARTTGPRDSSSDETAYAEGHSLGKNMNLAAPRIGNAAIKNK